jgi:hypothetical protein
LSDVSDAIEQRAAEVLASVPPWVWDGESVPVPVEDIADTCFGLRVCEKEDLGLAPGAPPLGGGQTLSGLLLAGSKEIWVARGEAQQWPGRRRFTIGHELGHWVLHRAGVEDAEGVFCRHASVEEKVEAPAERPPLPAVEQEANAFAAALLMPPELMRLHYEAIADGEKFQQMCSRFGASGAAMGRRLHAVI